MEPLFASYAEAIKQELERWLPLTKNHVLESVYFGGGTPTILPAETLASLLRFIYTNAPLTTDCEVTVEANPGTVDLSKLKTLRESGVTRLSLGVQSFDNVLLKKLGRAHSKEDVVATIQNAREAGFDNLSLDLIFGLPGQSLDQWKNELKTAFHFSPEHLSAYQLTVEEGTEFGRMVESGKLSLPHESNLVEMFECTSSMMKDAGYERYEISNYARDGKYCRHNLNTWRHGEYLALGAGACSFLDGVRRRNIPKVEEYIDKIARNQSPVIEEEQIEGKKELLEILMLGLRMAEGIHLKEVEKRTTIRVQNQFSDAISHCREEGLLRLEGDQMALTEKGMLFSNEVFLKLM